MVRTPKIQVSPTRDIISTTIPKLHGKLNKETDPNPKRICWILHNDFADMRRPDFPCGQFTGIFWPPFCINFHWIIPLFTTSLTTLFYGCKRYHFRTMRHITCKKGMFFTTAGCKKVSFSDNQIVTCIKGMFFMKSRCKKVPFSENFLTLFAKNW